MNDVYREIKRNQLKITLYCSTTDDRHVDRRLAENTKVLFNNISSKITKITVNWTIDDEKLFRKFVTLSKCFERDVEYKYISSGDRTSNLVNPHPGGNLRRRKFFKNTPSLQNSVDSLCSALVSIKSSNSNSRHLIVDFGVDLGFPTYPIYIIDPDLPDDYIYLPLVDIDSYYPSHWIYAKKNLFCFFSGLADFWSSESATDSSIDTDVFHLRIREGVCSRSLIFLRRLYDRSWLEFSLLQTMKNLNPRKSIFFRILRKLLFEFDLYFGQPQLYVDNSRITDNALMIKRLRANSWRNFGEFFKFFIWSENQREIIRFLDGRDFFNNE